MQLLNDSLVDKKGKISLSTKRIYTFNKTNIRKSKKIR